MKKIQEIEINGQTWMSENLDVSHFQNGDEIMEVKSLYDWTIAHIGKIPAYCYYNYDSNYGPITGKLYNWHAVYDPRKLTPPGWDIPNDEDWKLLNDYMKRVYTKKTLKNLYFWEDAYYTVFDKGNYSKTYTQPNSHQSLGFNAIPSGYCGSHGFFHRLGEISHWYVNDRHKCYCKVKTIENYSWKLIHDFGSKEHYYSVRCIKIPNIKLL